MTMSFLKKIKQFFAFMLSMIKLAFRWSVEYRLRLVLMFIFVVGTLSSIIGYFLYLKIMMGLDLTLPEVNQDAIWGKLISSEIFATLGKYLYGGLGFGAQCEGFLGFISAVLLFMILLAIFAGRCKSIISAISLILGFTASEIRRLLGTETGPSMLLDVSNRAKTKIYINMGEEKFERILGAKIDQLYLEKINEVNQTLFTINYEDFDLVGLKESIINSGIRNEA